MASKILPSQIVEIENPLTKKRKTSAPKVGVVEWFSVGAYEHVERVLQDLKHLKVDELRTGISWADWHSPQGNEWYAWLIPRLAKEVSILPCLLHTPPSLGKVPKVSSPPADPKTYADFLDRIVGEFGQHFEWVELWNEPNNRSEWDWTMDPDWVEFGRTIGGSAYWAKQLGKKTLLGGMSPIDPNWVELMFERGVMQYIDAVGIHGFPGTFNSPWEGWEANIARVKSVLKKHNSSASIWISEVGFSTWQHNEREQLREFQDALEAPVERVYWYAAYDLNPDRSTIDGFHLDEREYHFGLKHTDGTPKLLFRIWSDGGTKTIRKHPWLARSPRLEGLKKNYALITGGAGFIGTNLAHRLLSQGMPVLILDNLSRPGVERNLEWLTQEHGDLVKIEVADVRDPYVLRRCVANATQVFHFAAQVAVTTSLVTPLQDFEVNARGALNLLEAIRGMPHPAPLVFTSTNKVYGGLEDIGLEVHAKRYEPQDERIRWNGISEARSLDFHSPYGCSKGTADQYVIDYCRSYRLKSVVFRMSCIYGPHQFGTEDQGWVAHFLISALNNQRITIYGDGRQVRDILYVEDLVDAFMLAQQNMGKIAGQAFNIGGGPSRTVSLLELFDIIQSLTGRRPRQARADWRQGDQRYYVSNTRKFSTATKWDPAMGVYEGVEKLLQWLSESSEVPKSQALSVGGESTQ